MQNIFLNLLIIMQRANNKKIKNKDLFLKIKPNYVKDYPIYN